MQMIDACSIGNDSCWGKCPHTHNIKAWHDLKGMEFRIDCVDADVHIAIDERKVADIPQREIVGYIDCLMESARKEHCKFYSGEATT